MEKMICAVYAEHSDHGKDDGLFTRSILIIGLFTRSVRIMEKTILAVNAEHSDHGDDLRCLRGAFGLWKR